MGFECVFVEGFLQVKFYKRQRMILSVIDIGFVGTVENHPGSGAFEQLQKVNPREPALKPDVDNEEWVIFLGQGFPKFVRRTYKIRFNFFKWMEGNFDSELVTQRIIQDKTWKGLHGVVHKAQN